MRQPKPFYKKSHKQWYVEINRRQIALGPDKEPAWARYHEIMASRAPIGQDAKAVEILNAYLDHHKLNSSSQTYQFYRRPVVSFIKFVGARLKVSELKAHHVTDWINREHRYKIDAKGKRTDQPTSDTYRHNLMRVVKSAFNWAADEELIDRVPFRKLRKPRCQSRDAYLTPEQWESLQAAIEPGPFQDAIITLRETGCRPQELRQVEARHFNEAERCWIFPREESKGQRDSRVVLLTAKAFEVSQRLATQYKDGPLFRNVDGKPWRKDALALRCRRLSIKLGFPITAYAIRHTFATDAIVRGVDLETIATLMGHVDLKMLHRIYQHIKKRSDHLRAGLSKATGET